MKRRLLSFVYAFRGLMTLVRLEANARIHIFATIMVIGLGIFFSISVMEWVMLIFCIGLVISLEAINTAIEELSDVVSPDRHPGIRRVKDLAAGAVLVAAISSFIIGLIIFLPRFVYLF